MEMPPIMEPGAWQPETLKARRMVPVPLVEGIEWTATGAAEYEACVAELRPQSTPGFLLQTQGVADRVDRRPSPCRPGQAGATLIAIWHEHRTGFTLRWDDLGEVMVRQEEPVGHPRRDDRARDDGRDKKRVLVLRNDAMGQPVEG